MPRRSRNLWQPTVLATWCRKINSYHRERSRTTFCSSVLEAEVRHLLAVPVGACLHISRSTGGKTRFAS